jgi:hypothetical protein
MSITRDETLTMSETKVEQGMLGPTRQQSQTDPSGRLESMS